MSSALLKPLSSLPTLLRTPCLLSTTTRFMHTKGTMQVNRINAPALNLARFSRTSKQDKIKSVKKQARKERTESFQDTEPVEKVVAHRHNRTNIPVEKGGKKEKVILDVEGKSHHHRDPLPESEKLARHPIAPTNEKESLLDIVKQKPSKRDESTRV
eukprot:TRINITY_DN2491_c0_g1_i1.p1 TRINITY_DN2491_c0_g1~~TRINITY_DN2491_c0_g1_i1.p1  ORF type:complete len:157 (+),score=42.33 TRINITY_DN2491_c0_g1_i1:728-1198(+)